MRDDPLIGWRRWVVVRARGRYRLSSWTHPCVWEPFVPLRAEHPTRWRHAKHRDGRAPNRRCYCGIYGFRHPEDAVGWDTGPLLTAIGSVALWGRVVLHVGGFRGEFAYPQRLRVDSDADMAWVGVAAAGESQCRRCHSLHPFLNSMRASPDLGRPMRRWCEACSPRGMVDAVSVREIEQELQNSYAVELAAEPARA